MQTRLHQTPKVSATMSTSMHAPRQQVPAKTRRGLVFRSPKGKSRRIVRLPSPVLALLRNHKTAQDQRRVALGTAWTSHDLVFCQPDGRPIWPTPRLGRVGGHPNHCWAPTYPTARRTAHRRHPADRSRRASAGRSEILGHTGIRVTQKYTHVSSATARDAARIGAAVWPDRL